ncbi:hypothetical protein G6F21_014415 [Rhizopus arrhizus]|nr:hypothetical protein G6F21_014415 [Rhizopus arrhizus]
MTLPKLGTCLVPWAHREESGTAESPGERTACPGGTGRPDEPTRWGQPAGRDQTPRGKAQGHGGGQGEDRSAGESAF